MDALNRPKFPQCLKMEGGSVTFVFFKSIFRLFLIEFVHIAITRNLGQDGGGCHIETLGITLNHCHERFIDMAERDVIGDDKIIGDFNQRERFFHDPFIGFKDIVLIDFLHAGRDDGVRKGVLNDDTVKGFPFLRAQFL